MIDNESLSNILIVDDEPKNLLILHEYLEDMDYLIEEAHDGVEAWDILQQFPHKFDVILLDRSMPNMNGLEVLKKIKEHPDLKQIPVIMQTASVEKSEVLEGLQAGCYYYLSKPYDDDMLLPIVETAIDSYRSIRLLHQSLQEEKAQHSLGLSMLETASFRFRTINEARVIANILAAISPSSCNVTVGLFELLLNAVEHGNLALSYDDKSRLLKEHQWVQEIERRLDMPEYKSRYVTVYFEKQIDKIYCVIKDQGEGFNWNHYLEFSPERATHSHGRGIAMANSIYFDNIEYFGKGNEVRVTIASRENKTRE